MALKSIPLNANWGKLASASFPAASSVTISNINSVSRIAILVEGVSTSSASGVLALRFNGDTGSNYYKFVDTGAATSLAIAQVGTAGSTYFSSYIVELANTSAPVKPVINAGDGGAGTNGGYWRSTANITSLTLVLTAGGNFDAGTYSIWAI
jgi:hypothetical protein